MLARRPRLLLGDTKVHLRARSLTEAHVSLVFNDFCAKFYVIWFKADFHKHEGVGKAEEPHNLITASQAHLVSELPAPLSRRLSLVHLTDWESRGIPASKGVESIM